MYCIYRISPRGREPVVDLDTFEEVEPAIRGAAPGCYHVDEICAVPVPPGHTWRRWGIGFKGRDGSVVLDRWEE